jgi:hypothetical protein
MSNDVTGPASVSTSLAPAWLEYQHMCLAPMSNADGALLDGGSSSPPVNASGHMPGTYCGLVVSSVEGIPM